MIPLSKKARLPQITTKNWRWMAALTTVALVSTVLAATGPAPTLGATAAQAAAAPAKKCTIRPTNENTGAHGPRTDRLVTRLGSGSTLQNANVSSLEIDGSAVTVRNVRVSGNIFVSAGSSHVRIIRATTQGVGISSASDVVVRRSNIGYSTGDAIHVTSDAGSLVRNVRLRYNFIHDPRVTDGSHYDGTQVRGVDEMLIDCSTYRAGQYRDGYNAAVYLENANGGDSNVTVQRNWLYGYAFSVMVDAKSATFTGNRIGGNPHWGACYLGTSSGSNGFSSSGNVAVPSHKHVSLCGQG